MTTPQPISKKVYVKKNEERNSFLMMVQRNQIKISRFLLIAIYLCKFVDPSGIATKFTNLQYRVGTSLDGKAMYDIGFEDSYYVIHWIILVTFLRVFLMQWCFEPFASYFCNIHSIKAKVRFSEQSWSFVYYSVSFIFGAYLYYNSPYWLDVDAVYENWPNHEFSGLFKKYYLVSIAFWMQQIFVLNIEEKRKDHFQMFSHHIITCLLTIGSYYYYFFRIGHLILMIMDSVDIILSGAKLLKYSGFNNACDIMFLLFLTSWLILRHGVYNYLFYYTWFKARSVMTDSSCYSDVIQKRCWTPTIMNTFVGLLGGLQLITIVWMYLIAKVAYKVIGGRGGAEDVRSDDEEDDTVTEEINALSSENNNSEARGGHPKENDSDKTAVK